MNRRGEISLSVLLLVSIAVNAVSLLFMRQGFRNRSATNDLVIYGTNITVSIEQTVSPTGGADIRLKKQPQAAE